MKQNSKHRGVELFKDALIVLLTCSALWLAAESQLLAPLDSLLREDRPQAVDGQVQGEHQEESAVPMAMVINIPGEDGAQGDITLPEGSKGVRLGIMYDKLACQELFQQVAGILIEAVSGAEPPEKIDRAQWEAALSEQTGVYMDFQGEIPMSVLIGWLSGEKTELEGSVRRLILAVWEESTALYYRNEEDGNYYRCRSELSDPKTLEKALTTLTDNGAFYAFESEEYQILDPDTLLLSNSPTPVVYAASNPVNGGEESLRELVEELGFSLNTTNFYATDDWVARSGDDSVRLSERGVVEYSAGDGGRGLPVLRQGDLGALYDSVETCRQTAASVLGSRCGEAKLYLSSVNHTQEGLEIIFEYSLNGIPVCLEQGYAARFLVSKGQIVQFTMCIRNYTGSTSTSVVMPPKQATAAFSAMGLEGQELQLTYSDSGGDLVTAEWSARNERAEEG